MGNKCCHSSLHSITPLNTTIVDIKSITSTNTPSNKNTNNNCSGLHSGKSSNILLNKHNLDQYINSQKHCNLLSTTSTANDKLYHNNTVSPSKRESSSYIDTHTASTTHIRSPSIKHRTMITSKELHSIHGSIRNLPAAHKLITQISSNDRLINSIQNNNYANSVSHFKLNLSNNNSFVDTIQQLSNDIPSRRKSLRNTRIHHNLNNIAHTSNDQFRVHRSILDENKSRGSSVNIIYPHSNINRVSQQHSSRTESHNHMNNDSNTVIDNNSSSVAEIDVTQSFYNKFSHIHETHSVDIFINSDGAKQINQYIIECEIGRGTSAVVKKVLSLHDHKCYAMKVIDQSKLLAQNSGQWHTIQCEIAIMKKLSHTNIVQLYEVMHDTTTDTLYCIMEYCELGAIYNEDMFDSLCDPLPLPVALKYFQHSICAVNYLHQHNVIHRDIKPSNLLLCSNGTIKLTDFGVSLSYDNNESDQLHDTKGSIPFMSPETIQRNTAEYSGKASDIWSLGVTLYTFIYGKLPWTSSNVHELYKLVVNQPLHIPDTPNIPNSLHGLLLHMLDKNPLTRITMNDIMIHEWVTDNGTWNAREYDSTITHSDPISMIDTITQNDIANAVITVNKLSMMVRLKHKMKRMANNARNSARKSAAASFNMKFFTEAKHALDQAMVTEHDKLQSTNISYPVNEATTAG